MFSSKMILKTRMTGYVNYLMGDKSFAWIAEAPSLNGNLRGVTSG